MPVMIFCVGIKFDNASEFNAQNLEKAKALFAQVIGPANGPVAMLPMTTANKKLAHDEKPASDKQKKWVQSIARSQPVSEAEFYRAYDAASVDDLTYTDCDAIIKKYSLKTNSTSDLTSSFHSGRLVSQPACRGMMS